MMSADVVYLPGATAEPVADEPEPELEEGSFEWLMAQSQKSLDAAAAGLARLGRELSGEPFLRLVEGGDDA